MTEQMERFLLSLDFMRVGQAVAHRQWQAAYMALNRLEKSRAEAGKDAEGFQKPFYGLKMAIQSRNQLEAQQILSIIVNKRALFRNKKS